MNKDSGGMMGLECISLVMRMGRLRWFIHMKRLDWDRRVKRLRNVNVNGRDARG